MLDEHLRLGDANAAVVLESTPLLVAAYTDELDCVAVLSFSARLSDLGIDLPVGSRLLAVNTYFRGVWCAQDLVPGPHSLQRWTNFHPVIADFLSDDMSLVAARKHELEEAMWTRCVALGRAYLTRRTYGFRDGSPYHSAIPAKLLVDPAWPRAHLSRSSLAKRRPSNDLPTRWLVGSARNQRAHIPPIVVRATPVRAEAALVTKGCELLERAFPLPSWLRPS